MIAGRLLCVEGQEVWHAAGRRLLKSMDGGCSWTMRAVLPVEGLRERLTVSRIGRRLARSGYHHFVKTSKDSGLIIAHRHVFQMRPGDVYLHRITRLQGSRPLTLCLAEGRVYYGEYRRNPERGPIRIWTSDPKGRDWHSVWRFDRVRHVHGVFYDPYSLAIWVTTGDENNESAIWVTHDKFRTLNCVVDGSQQYRAVKLLFTREWIYFGSDAPHEQNHIYRINRSSGEIEVVCAVAGPVFHGTKVGCFLFFSTSIEPSESNNGRYAQVWGSSDGNTWKIVRSFRKDLWPMKYFQYGQVLFPSGRGDNSFLWCTPMATEYDQKTFKIPVANLDLH